MLGPFHGGFERNGLRILGSGRLAAPEVLRARGELLWGGLLGLILVLCAVVWEALVALRGRLAWRKDRLDRILRIRVGWLEGLRGVGSLRGVVLLLRMVALHGWKGGRRKWHRRGIERDMIVKRQRLQSRRPATWRWALNGLPPCTAH